MPYILIYIMIEPIKIANREIGIYTIMAAIGFAVSLFFITKVLKNKNCS